MNKTKIAPAGGYCPHYDDYDIEVVCCCDCDYYIRVVLGPELSLCSFPEQTTTIRALHMLAE